MRPECTVHPLRAAFLLLAASLAGCVVFAGCNGNKKDQQWEILPRDELAYRYNLRAEAINRLWARCEIEARVPKTDSDDKPIKGKYETYTLKGNLMLRKPRDLYLVGRVMSDDMFGFCSNRQMYWFWVKPKHSAEYHGRHDGPGADGFLLRPDYMLQTLAIFPLPDDLWAFRRGDELDVIQVMGVELGNQPAGRPAEQVKVMLHLVQEIYLERVKHDPVEVRLYDRQGEPLIITRLEKYEEIDGQRVPTRLVFHFVPVDWRLTLSLSKVSLTQEMLDAAFDYRQADVETYHDLDEEFLRPRARPAPPAEN